MNFYSPNHARFDAPKPLNEDEMRRIAPSIFATQAHESRSDRFAPIPTINILRELERERFFPVGVQQARSAHSEHCKHLIRLRRIDETPAQYQVGDTVSEVLLRNANDGSCCYELMAGLFRIKCLNSLVAQEQTLETLKVRHSGNVAEKVIEGTYSVLETATRALEAPRQWSTIELEQPERRAFAEAARVLRLPPPDDAAPDATPPIAAERFLDARRVEDQGNDLWRVFNRVQENTIRGGLHGITRDANNHRRRVSTRPIKGIDQSVQLNRALWTLSAELAKIKTGQAV